MTSEKEKSVENANIDENISAAESIAEESDNSDFNETEEENMENSTENDNDDDVVENEEYAVEEVITDENNGINGDATEQSNTTIDGFDMEHLYDSWDPYHSDKKKKQLLNTPVVGTIYDKHTSSKSYIKKQEMTPFEKKDRQFKIGVAIIMVFVFIIAMVASGFFTNAKKNADQQETIIREKAQEDLDNMKPNSGSNATFVNTLQNKKEKLTVTVSAPENMRDTQAELVVKGTNATGESINRIYHVPLNEPKEISMTQGIYTLSFTYDLKDDKNRTYSCKQVEDITLDESGKELFFEYTKVAG